LAKRKEAAEAQKHGSFKTNSDQIIADLICDERKPNHGNRRLCTDHMEREFASGGHRDIARPQNNRGKGPRCIHRTADEPYVDAAEFRSSPGNHCSEDAAEFQSSPHNRHHCHATACDVPLRNRSRAVASIHADHIHNQPEKHLSSRHIPPKQVPEAVNWTSNLVVQDFFSPNPEEYLGLQKLNQQLELKKNDPIDLAKLRWIWDEIAAACGGPDSVASRFRDVKLMTKGPITDEQLPSLWALERCTGLDLSETEITDASVTFLQSLPKLERLDINKTKITATRAKDIQNSRLGLRVFHETIP